MSGIISLTEGFEPNRIMSMVGQLYLFAPVQLGMIMASFDAVSLVLSNVLGFLVPKEVLTPVPHAVFTPAAAAFMVVAFR